MCCVQYWVHRQLKSTGPCVHTPHPLPCCLSHAAPQGPGPHRCNSPGERWSWEDKGPLRGSLGPDRCWEAHGCRPGRVQFARRWAPPERVQQCRQRHRLGDVLTPARSTALYSSVLRAHPGVSQRGALAQSGGVGLPIIALVTWTTPSCCCEMNMATPRASNKASLPSIQAQPSHPHPKAPGLVSSPSEVNFMSMPVPKERTLQLPSEL